MIHQLLFSSEVSLAGQETFTSPINATSSSIFSWVVPSGVTTICAVCVGGGGAGGQTTSSTASPGGGGGGLAYRNNIPVTPGETLSVQAGVGGYYGVPSASADGGDSGIQRGSTVLVGCTGGQGGIPGQSSSGGQGGASLSPQWGGGNGGDWPYATNQSSASYGGGGGAGGYSGNGGKGGIVNQIGGAPIAADSNSGAGGGGYASPSIGGGGGGVGLLGQGSDGIAGTSSSVGGGGGSSGTNGLSTATSNNKTQATGGLYGGGGFGRPSGNPGAGGQGAVRIIWGEGRAFPSTNTADV